MKATWLSMTSTAGPTGRSPWLLPLDSNINRTKSLNPLTFIFLTNKMYLKIIMPSSVTRNKK